MYLIPIAALAVLAAAQSTMPQGNSTSNTTAFSEGYLWTRNSTQTGLETDSVVPSTSQVQDNYDVVVIGAGFAGLTAARDLAASGEHRVLLVEARSRIGGRTWTAKAFGHDYEMGGTYVHWLQAFTYREISKYRMEGNIKQIAELTQTEETQQVMARALTLGNRTARQLRPWALDPARTPQQLWEEYDSLTLRDAINQVSDASPQSIASLENYFSNFGQTDPGNISFAEGVKWFAGSGYNLQNAVDISGVYKLGNGGTTSLALAMLEDGKFDRLFGAPVAAVDQDDSGVTVRLGSGRSITAKYAVSTIPLNVLSSVSFSPDFEPIRREAINRGHLGRGQKIHFRLNPPQEGFVATSTFRETNPFILAYAESVYDNSSSDVSGTNVVSFAFNDRIANVTDSDLVLSSFRSLKFPLGGNTTVGDATEVEAYLAHDWAADPYSNGTWSCWGPNAESRYLTALQQPHGRVAMASGDWAKGWRGYIDGAIEQGTRAAQDIEAELQRTA